MGTYSFLWMILIVISMIIEGLTLQLTTIWFAIGGVVALVLSFFNISLSIQTIIFLIVSIITLSFTRPICLKKINMSKVKTNIDSMIGQTCKVTETIDNYNNTGMAVFKGQVWTARSLDDVIIYEGELVYITEIRGVKIIVKR